MPFGHPGANRFICTITLLSLSFLAMNVSAVAGSTCSPQYVETRDGLIPLTDLPLDDQATLSSPVFTGNTLRVLVVPVQWLDPTGYRPATYPKEAFDTLFFSHNIRPNGSVAEYFSEVSYGQMTVTGDVLDWYDKGVYIPACSPSTYSSVIMALDSEVDFSQYDGNDDGLVDAVIILIAGNAQQDTQDFLYDP